MDALPGGSRQEGVEHSFAPFWKMERKLGYHMNARQNQTILILAKDGTELLFLPMLGLQLCIITPFTWFLGLSPEFHACCALTTDLQVSRALN